MRGLRGTGSSPNHTARAGEEKGRVPRIAVELMSAENLLSARGWLGNLEFKAVKNPEHSTS
jgi:hypothetical protein